VGAGIDLILDPEPEDPEPLNDGDSDPDAIEDDACPSENLGPGLSQSTDFDGVFPTLHSVDFSNPVGCDDAFSIFIGGNFDWGNEVSETEGNVFVMGDLTIEGWGGTASIGDAGVGSGIVPCGGKPVLTVGGNLSTDKTLNVMPFSPPGGDVEIGGSLIENGWGQVVVQDGRTISTSATIDVEGYEAMFALLEEKSEYWASLPGNGVVDLVGGNQLKFMAGDDESVQVFNVDADTLAGPEWVIDLVFDCSLNDKTILINVDAVEFSDPGWGRFVDCTGKVEEFSTVTTGSILWNFFNAETVNIGPDGNPQVQGSFLIPHGDLNFYAPGLNGRLMVGGNVHQESAGSEFHNYEFDPPTGLPLPPALCYPENRDDPIGDPELDEVTPAPTPAPTSTPSASPTECILDLPDDPEYCPEVAEVAGVELLFSKGETPAVISGATEDDLLYAIERSDDGATVTFGIQNIYKGGVRMHVYYDDGSSYDSNNVHREMCVGGEMVGSCEIADPISEPLQAYCIPAGEDLAYTLVHVYLTEPGSSINLFQDVEDPATLHQCCHPDDYAVDDVTIRRTFKIDCKCPTSTGRRLRGAVKST